jgi:hypothetical protein
MLSIPTRQLEIIEKSVAGLIEGPNPRATAKLTNIRCA